MLGRVTASAGDRRLYEAFATSIRPQEATHRERISGDRLDPLAVVAKLVQALGAPQGHVSQCWSGAAAIVQHLVLVVAMLGGALASVSEQLPFYAVAILAAVNGMLAVVLLPESRPTDLPRPPWSDLLRTFVPTPLRLIFAVHDRRIATFLTLFFWGGALYLNVKTPLPQAMFYAVMWGLAGMVLIAMMFHWMRKLTETGTRNIQTCLGGEATVYLDIPAGGTGEVRTAVSGVVTHVRARVGPGRPEGHALDSCSCDASSFARTILLSMIATVELSTMYMASAAV